MGFLGNGERGDRDFQAGMVESGHEQIENLDFRSSAVLMVMGYWLLVMGNELLVIGEGEGKAIERHGQGKGSRSNGGWSSPRSQGLRRIRASAIP